jgi:hypothetical protein
MEELLPRPFYMDRLVKWADSPELKILTGMRRCGKSSLLELLRRRLLSDGIPSDNLFYLRLDAFGIPIDADAEWLQGVLADAFSKADPRWPQYVFLDEIQTIDRWELVARQLHTRENTKVFITGSNAKLLSSELATHVAGRYVEIPVFPLSFREWLDFRDAYGLASDDAHDEFGTYLVQGGLPGRFKLPDESQESVDAFYDAIFNSILVNDVIARTGTSDVDLLAKLIKYLYGTVGNLFSTNKIVSSLTSMGRKTSVPTIDNYLQSLTDALLVHECTQQGVGGREVFRPLRKFYAPDLGLRAYAGGSRPNRGFALENAVYLELKRRGYDVHVGKTATAEIDFVANRMDEKIYVQVSESVFEQRVLDRESSAFEGVNDSFPKTILTMDHAFLGTTDQGYRIENAVDWMLREN